ncbi:MAG: DUF4160 domain-containing protein [Candidatus Electrothrix sp. Rat3]|nr:DUF4160 domain-containing protein [Candidatus Electrothrix rattekaaiensis]
MPSISMFYGIIVYMYYMDNNQHKLPHIHVKYQGEETVIALPDGEILELDEPVFSPCEFFKNYVKLGHLY